MVRPRKGTRVISPHSSELLWSCSRRQDNLQCAGEEEEGLYPYTLRKRKLRMQEGIWYGVDAHGLIAASIVNALHDEQNCHGKYWVRLMIDGAT